MPAITFGFLVKAACGVMVLVALSASACVRTHACTSIGCMDGASVLLRTPTGSWEPGEYVLTFEANGVTHTCITHLPEHLPTGGNIHVIDCDPPLGFPGASFSPVTVCEERRDGDSISQSCTPVPNQYTLSAGFSGMPTTLRVRVSRSGTAVLDQTLNLTYQTVRPNGPDCDPVCRQASVELQLN